MKKVLMTLMMCCFSNLIFAQQNLPFVSFTPVQADPVQFTPPPRPTYSDPMDPLGFGRGNSSMAVRAQSTSVAKEHFGMFLASYYNVDEIAWEFKDHYGDYVLFNGSGNFHQISVYYKCSKEGGTFGGCTITFYKGKFWQIIYRNIKNNPQEFANKLENKLKNYSISDTRYEYLCGDVYVHFDGEELLYTSESVTKAIAGY